MNAVIGLDIGNDTSVIAAAKQRGVDVLLNDESKRETPSVVSFTSTQRLLGSSAAASALMNPRSTVSHLKRLLARPFHDPSLSRELRFLPFPVREGPHGGILVRVPHRDLSPVQLLAMLLSHLRKLADGALTSPSPVSDCVIGVPAYFTDAHRRAYLDAAAIAGLRPLRLMQEGAAIALGYGIYRTDSAAGSVVFVDVGHSDTQVSVARFDPGKVTMLAYAFDRDLGGRDFDDVLFRHFSEQFKQRYNIDVGDNVKACMRLRAACEKVKKVLSANAEAQLSVECLMEETDVNGFVRREEFEGLSEELLGRIEVTCRKALEDAGLNLYEVHSVELVGSGSRIPAISRRLTELFGREPSRTLNASECIARGCALQCAMLSPIFRVRPYEVRDSFPFSVGFLTDKDPDSTVADCILRKGQPIPTTKILIFWQKETFYIKTVYVNSDELPPGTSQIISFSTIGPFQVSNDGKAKVKVKVRFDLHGILYIDSASLIEYDINAPVSESQPDFKSDMNSELYYRDSEGVHVIENGRVPAQACSGSVEECPSSDSMIQQGRGFRRGLEVTQRIFSGMTKGELAEAKSLEEDLAEKDRMIEEAKDKKNALEAYVYEIRNKLLDRYRSFASETEKVDISNSLNQLEEWLYDEGDDESLEVYSQKMNELGKLVSPIERRYKDEEARSRVMKELFMYVVELRKIEKSSHQTFVINEVISECEKVENWLRERGKEQESVPKNVDPVLWSEEIVDKMEELRRKCEQILTRASPRSEPSHVDRTHPTDDMEED